MNRRQRIAGRIVFFAYIATVLFLCFWNFGESQEVPDSLFGIPMDKLAHVALFLPFPLLVWTGFGPRGEKLRLRSVALLVAAGFLLAFLTEAGQSLTGYRYGDPRDLLADCVGLVLGLIPLFLLKKLTRL